ncbi:MAG: OHCU decarboxylase [Gammaproteobacteria bacterium]|nr:MAG: OHCU decarboxylase [Gammaproteobacteria bacterium]
MNESQNQLTQLNNLPQEQAKAILMQMCTSETWCERILQRRPFADLQALVQAADLAWQNLTEADYLQAFDGHPKIGDVNSLRAKYANTKALASGEQSAVNNADEAVLHDLAIFNEQYHAKFGFIFIVCATGKSAEQMLALLKARLPNDRTTELNNAEVEQGKIFQLRLSKYFN